METKEVIFMDEKEIKERKRLIELLEESAKVDAWVKLSPERAVMCAKALRYQIDDVKPFLRTLHGKICNGVDFVIDDKGGENES